jgi:dipeptidyl aminopeptidase/acylaminoacyl peptidase
MMMRHIIPLLLVAGLGAAAVGAERMGPQDVLEIARVDNPRISPDGSRVVFQVSKADTAVNKSITHLWLVSVEDGEPFRLTNGEKGESNPQWSPDSKTVFFRADRGEEKSQIWSIPVDGGEAVRVTKVEDGLPQVSWTADCSRFCFVRKDKWSDQKQRDKREERKEDARLVDERPKRRDHIWVYDLAADSARQVTAEPFDDSGPDISPDGRWVVFASNRTGDDEENNNTDLFIVSADSSEVRRLTDEPGPVGSPVFSPDGAAVAYTGHAVFNSFAEETDLWVVPVSGDKPANLTALFNYSVSGAPVWSPDGKSLHFTAGVGTDQTLYRVPVGGRGEGGRVKAVLAGQRVVSAISSDSGGRLHAVTITDPLQPADVYLKRGASDKLTRLSRMNENLSKFDLARTEIISWPGVDGFQVEGVLVYPVGYEKGKKYPVVVVVHGGPYGRFTRAFRSNFQLLAAQGYCVLAPNIRGSYGYGREFRLANLGQWGGRDFDDVMKGTDRIIELGLADPERLAIMGGSYGGFMTMWAVTRTNRFGCAIAHAGISDWYPFFGQTDIPNFLRYGFTGFPWEKRKIYEQFSAVHGAPNVTTPLLITHGEEDRRVPIAQSEEYYVFLKKLGKKVEFVRYPREGHGIGEPRHRLDLMERQIGWLAKYIGLENKQE